MLVCVFACAFCTRDRGCSAHPAFPAPSEGRETFQHLGRIAPREIFARLELEPSLRGALATKQSSFFSCRFKKLDCFAALAMTGFPQPVIKPKSRGVLDPPHARGMTICGWISRAPSEWPHAASSTADAAPRGTGPHAEAKLQHLPEFAVDGPALSVTSRYFHDILIGTHFRKMIL
jgi:hypothetical protein